MGRIAVAGDIPIAIRNTLTSNMPIATSNIPAINPAPKLGETQEVPRRIHEGVHRVGLTPRFAAAAGAHRRQKLLVSRQWRLACRQKICYFGQQYGQLAFGNGLDAALVAMDYWYRTTPESLAGNAPVSQAIVGDALADAFGFQPVGRLRFRLFHRQPV